MHGGHVLDSADLEVMESLAKICLSTVSPLGGKGPQILTDFISHHGNFGNHTTFLHKFCIVNILHPNWWDTELEELDHAKIVYLPFCWASCMTVALIWGGI